MKLFHDFIKSPLKLNDAPDNNSMIAAARVRHVMQLADGYGGEPVEYIMEYYGDSREEAEAIVRNCREHNID